MPVQASMGHLWADVRYAMRMLRQSPGFAVVAIGTLALGIGANTAIFSLVDAVLVRPLPFPDADRLVALWEDASFVGFAKNTPAPANYADWKARNRVFTDVAAMRSHNANLSGDGQPELVMGRRVTANLFSVMGVQPMLGRTFTLAEDVPDSRLVVLSYGLWQRRYGGDTAIVGRTIAMSGLHYTVIGVMPPAFHFPLQETEYWVPAGFTAQDYTNRGQHFLRVVARMQDGVTLEQARADMNQIALQLQKEYPRQNEKLGVVVTPLREELSGGAQTSLLVLAGAAGMILLIGCANLANLLLTRATARTREIAVRLALGASRGRLLSQLLTESLVLALIGGACGVMLAWLSLDLLAKLIPENMRSHATLGLNTRLLAFAVVASVGTGVLFGLAPAWQSGLRQLVTHLREGSRGGTGSGAAQRMRSALVVGEVALAVMLLSGAGLLLRAFWNLQSHDPGFRASNLLTMSAVLPAVKYPDGQAQRQFYANVLERVKALPGVQSAAFCQDVPMSSDGNTNGYLVEGQTIAQGQDALYRPGTAHYLQTLGAQVKAGRLFDDRDRDGTQPVVVINETLARTHWPQRNAVGQRLRFSYDNAPWMTVIGVIADLQERDLEKGGKPAVYIPHAQQDGGQIPRLVVRTAQQDPLQLTTALRDAIWSVDREQPVMLVRTGEQWLDRQVAGRRQQLSLLLIFAGLALGLAAVGIYGVLSYTVVQRTREIGVRTALGAEQGDVLRMVFRRGFLLVGLGLLCGTAGALAGARIIASLLYNVSAGDAQSFGGAALLLGIVAALACYLPARRAAGLDPMVALRDE